MLFRGTPEHPSAHQLAAAFESLGTTLDASTAADHGSMSVSVPHENLEAVIALMGAVVREPILREVELERGIIIEEIHEEQNDEGQWIDPGTLTRMSAFEGSSLAQPIIGPLSNVESFTRDRLLGHHRDTYGATGMVAGVAGPCDAEKVTRMLRKHFGDRPATPLRTSTPPPAQTAPRYRHVRQPGSSQTTVAVAFRSLGRHHADEATLDMLLRVIDDGLSTRLYHRLCDQSALCYSASASYETYDDVGLVEFEAEPADRNAPRVLEELARLTDELASELVSASEFERARQRVRWQFESLADDAFDVADFYSNALFEGTVVSADERLARLLAVSREDLRNVAERLFASSQRNVVTIGNPSSSVKKRLEELALRA